MKRLLNLTLVVLAVLALAAPSHTTRAAGKSLSVYIAGGLSQAQTDWFNKTLFPAFAKANPDFDAAGSSVVTSTWAQFDTSIQGWLSTGSGPDIVYLGSEYANIYGKVLANIDDQIKSWPDLKSYLPAALGTATYNGHLVGLPVLMGIRARYYRTDLATPSGKDFKVPATFADDIAFAKANTVIKDNALQQQAYVDINGGLFDDQEFVANIWAAGGELYKADGTSAFDSDATAEVLQYMYDRRRAVLPTETVAALPTFQGPPLASGKVVSGIFPTWNLPDHKDKMWDNIAVAPYPAGKNGKQLIQVFTDWLSVPAYTPNKDLAVKFLEFIGSKDNALTLSSTAADGPAFGWVPVRTDAWTDLQTDVVWKQLLDLAQKYGRGYSDIRGSAELRPFIVQQVKLFLTDQQSLKDTQTALKQGYDAILQKDGFLPVK